MRRVLVSLAFVLVAVSSGQSQASARWVIGPFALYTHPVTGRQVYSGKLLFYSNNFANAAASQDTQTRVPKRNWSLMVACQWRPEAEADPELIFLPNMRLGQEIGDQAGLIGQALKATDIDVVVNPTDTLRQLLIRIARQKLDQTDGFNPTDQTC